MTVRAHQGETKGFWTLENISKSLSQVSLTQPEPIQLSNCGETACFFYKTKLVVSVTLKKVKAPRLDPSVITRTECPQCLEEIMWRPSPPPP